MGFLGLGAAELAGAADVGVGAAELAGAADIGVGAADVGAGAADVIGADVIGADVLGAGAGDVLAAGGTDAALAGGAGVGADLLSTTPLAADASGGLIGGGVADASLFAPTADAAGAALGGGAGLGGDLLGLGVGADLGGLGVGADLGGFGAGGAGAAGAGADIGATGLATSSLLPASPTATAPLAGGGAFSAGQELTAAADPSSILDISGSGSNLASLDTGSLTDAGTPAPYTGLDPATNLAGGGGGGGGGPGTFSGGPDLLQASDSSAIGGGGGPSTSTDVVPKLATPTTASGVAPPAAGGGATAPPGGGGPTPPPGGGGSGGGGGLFGLSGRDLLMGGLALGPLAYTMTRGESPVPPQANQATALSPQEQALASQMMTSVQTNTPTPSQAAVIAQNTQNAVNAARQQLFNMGVQNPESDSRWPYMMQQIQQQQLVQTQAFMQQNMQTAMAAAGPAQQGLLSVAQMQAAQDQAYTTALSNAMRSAGTVLALGAGAKPTVNVGL